MIYYIIISFIICFIIIFFLNKKKDSDYIKIYENKTNNKIEFKDIIGLDNAKKEIQEIVYYLNNNKNYNKLGGKIPLGILLEGPPGTGKTILAKAIAQEINIPFLYVSGSSFVEIYIGIGAYRIRELFKKAKEISPAIIFIDEIDAIGKKRVNLHTSSDEIENTLNQLLIEMDGFENKTNIIVIGATNRSNILDKALLRPGRFDKRIVINLPNKKDRKKILKYYLNKMKIIENINFNQLSNLTIGLSPAEIFNICNDAALIALRQKQNKIDNNNLYEAIDRFLFGFESKISFSNKELKRIAYHEIGHVLVNYILKNNKLIKVTINSREKLCGYTFLLQKEKYYNLLNYFKNNICVILGGRASEYLIYNNYSTGAIDDLNKCTKLAYNLIAKYGYKTNISYYNFNPYKDKPPYSQQTAYKIDKKINRLISLEFIRSKQIILKNIKILHLLSKELLKYKVLFKKDIDNIIKNG
ncbi:MAG: AAA family ATPase [Candidatus Shikimatogenerans bostrichidophilus]|nr:MAG: AAA family ATPase [Candidatus Shikimatogenerans bostrichidophilus]